MQALQNARTPKRRIMLVEKAFQLRFVLKMTGLAVLGTGLTAGLLFLLADRELAGSSSARTTRREAPGRFFCRPC